MPLLHVNDACTALREESNHRGRGKLAAMSLVTRPNAYLQGDAPCSIIESSLCIAIMFLSRCFTQPLCLFLFNYFHPSPSLSVN